MGWFNKKEKEEKEKFIKDQLKLMSVIDAEYNGSRGYYYFCLHIERNFEGQKEEYSLLDPKVILEVDEEACTSYCKVTFKPKESYENGYKIEKSYNNFIVERPINDLVMTFMPDQMGYLDMWIEKNKNN